MDTFLRSTFLIAGQAIASIGSGLTFLLIGMAPLYIAAYLLVVEKVAFRNSKLLYASLIALFLGMSAVIWIAALVMGMWG